MRAVIICWLFLEHYYLYNTLKVQYMDESMGTSISNRWGMGGGFLTLMYGWLTDASTAVFIGVLVTVGGFVMSFYFQRRKNSREKVEAALRRELLLKEEQRKEELHQAQLKKLNSMHYSDRQNEQD